MSQSQLVAKLEVGNDTVEQEPYVQFLMDFDDKRIRPDYYVTRTRAARECYRYRLNFMRFMRDCPEQMDTWKIDSNVFLGWLEQHSSPCGA
jgi:hypothetical protein